MGLQKYQVASVSPGAARNHLVPSKAAVYAHYVNRERYKYEIESAEAADSTEPEDQQAMRAKIQQARLLKRLKTIKLVCLPRLLSSTLTSFSPVKHTITGILASDAFQGVVSADMVAVGCV